MKQISDYNIDISDATLAERLELRKLLESLNEKIHPASKVFERSTRYTHITSGPRKRWCGGSMDSKPSITMKEVIKMFSKPKIKFTI